MNLDFSQLGSVGEAIVDAARTIASAQSLRIFLVGGPVRDLILNRETIDIDLMSTEHEIERFAPHLTTALGGSLERFPKFLTMKVATPDAVVDLAAMRRETYASPGALPLVAPGSLDEDLYRRDFTVNSIALDIVSGEIVDPSGGMRDLEHGLLRYLHERSFLDDPTRILRGVRLAARIGLKFESATEDAARTAISSGAFNSISRERSWREIFLLFRETNLEGGLERLQEWGFLLAFLGRDQPLDSRRITRIETCSFLSRRERDLAFIAILLRGSQSAKEALAGSGVTRREMQQILNPRLDTPAPPGLPGLDDEQTLRQLVHWGALGPALSASTDDEFNRLSALVAQLESARESMPRDLDSPPGPHIGRALRETLVALAMGRISPAQARDFAQERAIEYLREDPATPDG